MVAEGGGDSYGREAVVDVGFDALGDIGDDEGGVADNGGADHMQVGERWVSLTTKPVSDAYCLRTLSRLC